MRVVLLVGKNQPHRRQTCSNISKVAIVAIGYPSCTHINYFLGTEDLLIPGNIPTIQLKDLTPEEELFYFASERDLYISGLQVIVNCSRLAENNFEDNHMYGPFIVMVLLDEVTLSHHLRTERYAIIIACIICITAPV